jgi:hypothetical protein
MAEATVTSRDKYTYGNLKGETGKVAGVAGAIEIRTGLGRIVWFRWMPVEADTDGVCPTHWNYSDAGTTAAPGVVHFEDGMTGTPDIIYDARGFG